MKAVDGKEEDLKRRHTHEEQRKYDGTRSVVIKDGDTVIIRGRSWINDYAPNFPELVAEVRKIPVESCVLDAELTFFKKGTDKDVFLTALASPQTKKPYTAKLMVFDALYVEDYDIKDLSFTDRQDILLDLIPTELQHVDVVKTITKDK